jgi:hypothetical protein
MKFGRNDLASEDLLVESLLWIQSGNNYFTKKCQNLKNW